MADNKIIFFLTKLVDLSERDTYEQWVREIDTPAVLGWDCTSDYRVVRLDGAALEGVSAPGYSDES